MKVGVTLRNMGPQSRPDNMLGGARHAEQLGFDSVWITDHIAIPPDDAEGSGGRYTDPLTTLAWLAGSTTRIGLGAGVLVVPYRRPLPLAKAIATVHELSGERLLLGLAVGWMAAEFRALGVPLKQRGALTESFLEFFAQCFGDSHPVANDQAFIFDPKPAPPPVYLGGRPPPATARAARFGHGWLPMVDTPERLAPQLEGFTGPVTAMGRLPLEDLGAAQGMLDRFAALGIERFVCAVRYETLAEYQAQLDVLAMLEQPG
ncbi:MAG: LLM class flavin-dependent oxidoreductase [Pseudomonadota bacterium]